MRLKIIQFIFPLQQLPPFYLLDFIKNMDRKQKTFQFPKEYQRHFFNQVGTRQDLKRVMRSLMSSSTYSQFGIRYIIQQTEQGSQDKLKRMVAYLTCCGETGNRPIICFASLNQGRYIFQSQKSIFTHHHHVDEHSESDSDSSDTESSGEIRNSSSDQNDESQSEKNQENQIIVKSEESDSILDSYFPQFPQKGQVLPWANQQFSQNVNEQNDEPIQMQLQPQPQMQMQPQMQQQPTYSQGIFQFPSLIQIEKFRLQKKKNPLRATFCNFIKQGGRQHSIKYKTQTTIQKNQNQKKVFHLKFIYNCCNGINGDQPYLLFQSFNDNDYSLKDYNLLHYHKKRSDKKITEISPVMIRKIAKKTKEFVGKKIFKQQQFEFPLRSELEELQKFADIYEIKKAYQKLRLQPHHKDKKISFVFQQYGDIQQLVCGLNIKFSCCNGKASDAYIKYVSNKGNFDRELLRFYRLTQLLSVHSNLTFSLSKNYNLTHVHDVKMSQMQQESQPQKEIAQNDFSVEVNQQKINQQKQQIKNVINQDFQKQIRQIPKMSIPISLSIDNESNLGILHNRGSQKNSNNPSAVFQFPQKLQMQKLGSHNNKSSIRSTFSNFIIKDKRFCKADYNTKSDTSKNQKGLKIFSLEFKYNCCKGINGKKPYLRYQGRTDNDFRLKGYSLLHDHSKKEDDKKQIQQQVQLRKRGEKESKGIANQINQQIKQKKKVRGKEKRKLKFTSQKVSKQKKITKLPRGRKPNPKKIQQIVQSPVISHKKKLPQDNEKMTKLNGVKVSIPTAAQNKKQPQAKQLSSKPCQIKQVIVPEQNLSKISEQVHPRINQRIIPLQQQRNLNTNTKMYQKSQNFNWNFNHQLKDSGMILYWLKKYSDKLYRQLQSISPSEINMTQINQSLSREVPDFCELIKNRTYTKKIWNECIEKLLTSQNILMLQIPPQAGQNSDEFQYQDILFVTSQLINMKKSEQQPKNGFSLLLYIGVYPIKLSSTSQNLNLTVAYTLTKSLEAQLVWFCFTKSNQSPPSRFEDLLTQKTSQNPLFIVIEESVLHLNLQKVNFIYTTLNYQLIDALQNIQQKFSRQTSKIKLDYQMHFQCINALVTKGFDENSKVMQSIYDNIRQSPNKAKIMKSFFFIKNILHINKTESRNNSQNCRNPRLIYQNFQTFTEMFSQYKLHEFNQMGLNFLSSEYFNEKDLVGIVDPVNQIKTIFSGMNGMNQLNILEEAFVLLMVFFDPKRKNLSNIYHGSSLIPMDLYLAQQQCLNYKSIWQQQQKSEYFSIESIIQEPAYELLQIARKCPRIITQTIYRLIHLANQIKSREDNQLNLRNSGQQMHSDKDMDPHMMEEVNQINQQPPKIGKFGRPVPSVDKGEKRWSCACRFYENNGIPCENQILFALKKKTSLFKEIHPNWKHSV